jgi:hypothetical protein
MKTYTGNIWDLYPTHVIVITTNLTLNSEGSNIMGKGLALQAKQRFKALPKFYGSWLRGQTTLSGIITARAEEPLYAARFNVICFPTKYHWRQPSDLRLIEQNCNWLVNFLWQNPDNKVALTIIGTGAGRLSKTQVLPLLEKYFGRADNTEYRDYRDRVTLCV